MLFYKLKRIIDELLPRFIKAPTIQPRQIRPSRMELMIPATKILLISIDVYKMRYYSILSNFLDSH